MALSRSRRLLLTLAPLALALAVIAGLLTFASRGVLGTDANALALVGVPLTGGSIESVTATGPGGRPIPVVVRGKRIWPRGKLAPGEPVSISAVVRRPGWIAWLAGSHTDEHLRLRTPIAAVTDQYLTLARGAPLVLSFDTPVKIVAYGTAGALHRRVLAEPRSRIPLVHGSLAGTIETAATARAWETLPAPTVVSWFPPGVGSAAVASPRPGTQITPTTPISLTFSEPVSAALGASMPHVLPATQGHWRTVDAHTIVFEPSGYGYGLGAAVSVALPSTVAVVGGQRDGAASAASWTVPLGSPVRVEQILAQLEYLPLDWRASGAPVAATPSAQETAAVAPPAGDFSWRFADAPSALRELWQSAERATITRGALMAFESVHNLTTDGVAGAEVWRALIRAAVKDERAHGGYSFVTVSESSQSLSLWHDGRVVLTTPVNTGIAAAPTALGTYPVYEHIASGTMSGTNPDGSHYEDPGIPWISYFNGGDALHGFVRASYGFPQSLGCVEMPISTAGEVWPYTPIGTIVHIA